ncbi:MAG: hypothetical protein ACLUE2_13560 [Bacteroides cellulosilyticus]
MSVQETDTNIILQISDQGYGISQEKQKSIFNRFENYVSSDIFKKQKYRHRVVFSKGTGRVTQRQNHFTEQNKRGFHFHHLLP